MTDEEVSNHGKRFGVRCQEGFVQEIHLRRVRFQEGHGQMQLLRRSGGGCSPTIRQQWSDQFLVVLHLIHDARHLFHIGAQQGVHQSLGRSGVLLLDSLCRESLAFAHDASSDGFTGCDKNSENRDRQQGAQSEITRRSPHHPPLRVRPLLPFGQPADAQIFPPRRQLLVLRFGVPEGRALSQPQFRSTAPRFLLLSREPVAQRGDQIVVGELEVLLLTVRVP